MKEKRLELETEEKHLENKEMEKKTFREGGEVTV